MFKRFVPAEDISTRTAIKSSVQRGIKKSICDEVRVWLCTSSQQSTVPHSHTMPPPTPPRAVPRH